MIYGKTGSVRSKQLHAGGLAVIVAVACLVYLNKTYFAMEDQLLMLVGSVALLGIPHGALDLALLKYLHRRSQRPASLAGWLTAYVALALAVVGFWVHFPVATLTAFLIASVAHFGLEDTQTPPANSIGYVSEVALRGTLPIVVPITLHPEAVAWLFSHLVPAASADILVSNIASAWLVLPVLFGTLVVSRTLRAAERASIAISDLVEIVATALLFITLPPLVAFAIYFGLLHSLRHLWRVALTTNARSPREQIATLLRKALPASTVTWMLLLAAWMLPTSVTAIESTIQVIFIGLAALTLPHGLLLLRLRYLQRQSAGLSTRTAH